MTRAAPRAPRRGGTGGPGEVALRGRARRAGGGGGCGSVRRRPAPAADRVGDPGRAGLRRGAATQHEWSSPHAASRCESTKGAWITDSPDQAESRVRPFNRRFFSNARPARVCIRWRNPCFLLRRRLLGWNVRFTHGLLGPRVGAQTWAPGTRARLRRPCSVRPSRSLGQSEASLAHRSRPARAGRLPSPCRSRGAVIRSESAPTGPAPSGACTSPLMFTFGLGEAARAAAGPSEGFLHTCG